MTSFMNQRKHLDTTMSDHMNNFINRYKFDCSNTNKHKQQLAKTSRGSYNIEEFKKYYTENAKLLKGLEDCINITIVGINRTMEEFSNHRKIIDAKVQLLINKEKR